MGSVLRPRLVFEPRKKRIVSPMSHPKRTGWSSGENLQDRSTFGEPGSREKPSSILEKSMSRRGHFFLWGGILAGLLIVNIVYWISLPIAPAGLHPPEIGGQKVPAEHFEIRFDQKYDLYCSFYSEEPTVYRGCLILGFTGSGEGAGGFSLSSQSASSYGKNFDHWLVLKLDDGRLAYIPTHSVKYIEQASPPDK